MKIFCYLCGGPTTVIQRKLRHGEKRAVLGCRRCSLVFLEPITQDLRAWYQSEYRRTASPVLGSFIPPQEMFRIRSQFQGKRVAEVKKFLNKKARVLEIGCSTGHFLAAIRPFVKECVGIEYNKAHAAFIRRKLGFKIFETPIEETSLSQNHFDLICLYQVFEHIEDPVTFLKSIRPYLKKGGHVVIEVPNLDDALLSLYRIPSYRDFYYHRAHLFYYNEKTLLAVMRKGGFRGVVKGFQQYNLLNHLHWRETGNPQQSAEIGMGIPTLVENTGRPKEEKVLNGFIRQADSEYQELLKKNLISDSLLFIGTSL